jgi:hypothetical protein
MNVFRRKVCKQMYKESYRHSHLYTYKNFITKIKKKNFVNVFDNINNLIISLPLQYRLAQVVHY